MGLWCRGVFETLRVSEIHKEPCFNEESLPLEGGQCLRNGTAGNRSLCSETEKTVGLDTNPNLGYLEKAVPVDQYQHVHCDTELLHFLSFTEGK